MIGDASNMLGRLRSLIPRGWLSEPAPIANATLGGLSDSLAGTYALIGAARLQTRLATSSGYFLDLTAYDFFGLDFPRRPGETDDSYRARIKAEIFRERVTRKGVSVALTELTGRAPLIFEPWNPGDCGAYDLGGLAYAGSSFVPVATSGVSGGTTYVTISVSGYDTGPGGLDIGVTASYDAPLVAVEAAIGGYGLSGGYDVGLTLSYDIPIEPSLAGSVGLGCYGSLELPFQMFVTAYRPLGGGIANVGGFDTGPGGYDVGYMAAYVDLSEVQSQISDAEIYATVAANAAAGIRAWTAIQD